MGGETEMAVTCKQGKQKLKDKIQKLLNLAYNEGATEDEAKVALLKAQQLLHEHNIDESELGNDKKPPKVIDKVIDEPLTPTKRTLYSALANHFPVFIVLNTTSGPSTNWKSEKRIRVFGHEEAVEIYIASCLYIGVAFENCWQTYRKDKPFRNPRRVRNDYMFGFLRGLKEAFEVQETALMVITKCPAIVEDFAKETLPNLKKGPQRTMQVAGNANAREAGYQDGRSVRNKTALNA
jgi:hypothetical protein